jgi:hypothetical protein
MRGKLLLGYIENPRLEGFINGFIACERHVTGWFDRSVEYKINLAFQRIKLVDAEATLR